MHQPTVYVLFALILALGEHVARATPVIASGKGGEIVRRARHIGGFGGGGIVGGGIVGGGIVSAPAIHSVPVVSSVPVITSVPVLTTISTVQTVPTYAGGYGYNGYGLKSGGFGGFGGFGGGSLLGGGIGFAKFQAKGFGIGGGFFG
ncbi:keratin, type II cytoskeletal 1 [Scaptodrosophila lebanonensis]|uniref:Keratin, type II cytoskeletal 1 n=1 Tax=Drosophila lebanonensis TaxID=7225 RepID=A0A6J2UGG4_DROLE|nr:keratin, type II cytoskeletal 1 [Scaptodrosophila lebanonensis]